jgi:hypothetical protein
MKAAQTQLPESRTVGAQLVGDQQLRCEALFLEQFAHQPECRLRISPTLNKHVEDLALVVDGAPQVHPFPAIRTTIWGTAAEFSQTIPKHRLSHASREMLASL